MPNSHNTCACDLPAVEALDIEGSLAKFANEPWMLAQHEATATPRKRLARGNPTPSSDTGSSRARRPVGRLYSVLNAPRPARSGARALSRHGTSPGGPIIGQTHPWEADFDPSNVHGEGVPPPDDTALCGTSSTATTRMDCLPWYMQVPDYVPCQPHPRDALGYLWSPFLREREKALSLSDLDTWTGNWMSERVSRGVRWRDVLPEGKFFGPQLKSNWAKNPTYALINLALWLIDSFRDLIPNDGACCANARDKVSHQFENSGYWLEIRQDEGGLHACGDAHSEVRSESCGGAEMPQYWHIDGMDTNDGPTFAHTDGWGIITLCYNWLKPGAEMLDTYLLLAWQTLGLVDEGHLADTGPASGAAGLNEEEERYVSNAKDLGALAMGCVLEVARTILHEMLHVEYAVGIVSHNEHCRLNCCMQRLSLKWTCRVAAVTGARPASPFGVDFWLEDRPFVDESMCNTTVVDGKFRGECYMASPGVPSGSSDWGSTEASASDRNEESDSWRNPAGCDTSGC